MSPNLETPTASQAMNDLGTVYHDQAPSFSWKCYEKSIQLQMQSLAVCAQTDFSTTKSSAEIVADDVPSNVQLLERSLRCSRRCREKKNVVQATPLKMESSLFCLYAFSNPIEASRNRRNNDEETCTVGGEQASAITVYNMALLGFAAQCYEETTELLEISLELIKRAKYAGATCSRLSEMAMMVVTNLGFLSFKFCRYEEATFFFENAVKHIRCDIGGKKHCANTHNVIQSKLSQFIHALLNLARAYDASGHYDKAMTSVSEARLLSGFLMDSSLDIFRLSYTEAMIRLHEKKNDLALSMFESLCDAHWESLSPGQRAAILHGMGLVSFEKRDLEGAMVHLLAALTITEKTFGENHSAALETLYTLGRILHDREEYTDALEVYNRVLNIQKTIFEIGDPSVLKTLCNIARVQQARGYDVEAFSVCSEALQVGEVTLGPKHTFIVEMLIMQGTLLHRLGKVESASAIFNKVVRIMNSPRFNAKDIFPHFNFSCGPSRISGASAA